VLYSFFVLGMVTASLAGTIETLFAGWELVGLSSALLVAFHLERVAPVRNGLRVWTVYRVSDAALLIAAVVMHHLASEGDFDKLLMNGDWPEGQALLTESQALAVGLLLLIAAAGKSALVPFSGWLPRAMEGPTPSSAVFYGALSVHLGAFLLLRVGPLIDLSFTLQAIIVALGLVTAIYAALVARVQTDIKTALSFASLTQVGIIVVEIGIGLRYIALIHLLGHACLRTLQFVRAPSLLVDYRVLENAIGNLPTQASAPWERLVPKKTLIWLYQLGLERGYLDAWLDNGLAAPFLNVIHRCDAMERRWVDMFSQRSARDEQAVEKTLMPVDSL
jgi:NAD(P)H-quinone oxidoreductase subunit 5